MSLKVKVGLFLALCAALAWGAHAFYRASRFVTTNDAQVEAKVVRIAPKVSGRVSQVLVNEHQLVRRGQLLLVLDAADYKVRLTQARAKLAQLRQEDQAQRLRVALSAASTQAAVEEARARIGVAEARVVEARSGLGAASHGASSSLRDSEQAGWEAEAVRASQREAREQVQAAHAETERAAKDVERFRKLFAEEAIPRQLLDNAEAEWRVGQEREQASQQRVLALSAQTSASQSGQAARRETAGQEGEMRSQAAGQVQRQIAELAQAQAQLEEALADQGQVAIEVARSQASASMIAQAREQIRELELQLSYTKLYAPWDGRIGQRPVEEGAYLQVGQSALEVVSTTVWVTANFKETQLARVKPGRRAWVELDAFPDRRWPATVDSLQPGTGSRFALIPAQNASGNWVKVIQRVPVKLIFDSSLDQDVVSSSVDGLSPGMSATVEVETP